MDSLEYLVLCFSTLFTLVNPIGISTIFLALTERFEVPETKIIVRKATITGIITLLIFSFLGKYIFQFYSITLDAFKIMGGIIFFRTGLRMLEAIVSRTRSTPQEQQEGLEMDDIGISPVGIPLLTGPGAITGAMVLSGKATSTIHYAILVGCIILVMLFAYFMLIGANKLSKRLGTTWIRVIQRIMGILLMVISIQFIIDGATPVLQTIISSSLE
ncbi:MAG: antibiotic resistance protein MarC [Candidatus Marinimicrobia bacterium]|nr:antibiotic resistance protein MarC [Candidatus Neomarinimicrobiota bacterium]|tara:strand:+ start:14444 stop:15091 length:648 start_codon:yes stop_codon:yes gene_type:complete